MILRLAKVTYKAARRAVIAVLGATVLLIGVVMLVTPGPGLVVIPLGLAILSLEFAWARHWLKQVRERISRRGSAARAGDIETAVSRARGE